MLTRVLLTYYAKAALGLLTVGFGLTYMILGDASAIAFLAAAAVMLGGGVVQIWMAGKLLDPRGSTASKASVTFVLLGKLAILGALLWYLINIRQLDGVGVIVGMGFGLASLVVGVNWGSTSPEGQQAISEAEREIAQEMEDKPEDSQ